MVGISLNSIMDMSFIGLGLVLGLYAIIIDKIEELLEKQYKDLKKAKKKRDRALEKVSKDKDDDVAHYEYTQLRETVKQLNKPKWHYNYGYIGICLLFSISLFFSYFGLVYLNELNGILAYFVNNSWLFLGVGIIVFMVVMFLTMVDIRRLTLEKFDSFEEREKEIENSKK